MADQVCSACGTQNAAGAKFCAECGQALAVICAQCGTAATGGRFCSECGASLTGAGGSPPVEPPAIVELPAAPVAERRVVSLLFGDLVGFTPLSESKDPEAVRELLSAYFDRARAVVERYGGTVEKFIGDAVFAVWGVPAAREDDAERAVRAGLDLTSAAAALGEELNLPGLQMRVGITTGQVAVTLGAVGEGMVAGDAVNTAARVQAAAAPSQVWVDDTTRSLTSASLAYDSMGPHELKGKAQPMELFHATRTTAVVGGEQRVDGLEAPFVGRDRELRMVKELFHASVEEGRPRLVLVAGEPGIGKSRLAWEFEKYVDAIPTESTWWMRARCLSYGDGVGGRVVAELVRYLFRLTDADDEDSVRQTLDTRLHQHITDAAERDVLRPRMESLLGLSDQVFDQGDLFACWRGFLEGLTYDGQVPSVTIVIDDYQWADDGLHAFLDHLLEAARVPITVLVLARPEVRDRHPGVGVGRRSTTVFLEPLPDAPMTRLLDGLVTDLPDALRTELVQRAEGIPLYAVETVRALIDRDVAVPRDGRYVVDPDSAAALDLAALGPPASLQALLAARLDSLPDEERRVVQDASVLGMSFTRSGIDSLTPAGVDLEAALAALRHKEILTVDTDPRSPERGQYRFVQALLRGVAYDTLSRRDRRARHLSVAEYLGGLPEADSISGIVATHYLDALESMPDADDAGTLRERASALLEQAAVYASAAGSPALALSHYSRLLTLDPRDDVVIRATTAASRISLQLASGFEQALMWTELGLAAADRSGTEDDTLWLRLQVGGLLVASGQSAAALPMCRIVFDASSGRADRIAQLGQATRLLCLCAQNLGDLSLAQDAAVGALADVERYGDDRDFATYLDTMSMWFGLAGYRRLSTLVRRAAASSYDALDPAGVPPLINLAAVVAHDDPREAQRLVREAITRNERLGLPLVAAIAHFVGAATSRGNFSEAMEWVRAHRAEGVTALRDWETYLAAGSAVIAWGTTDPSLLVAPPEGGMADDDDVVAAWWLMHQAVTVALGGDLDAGARVSVQAVERMIAAGPANEDLPLAYALAVDMLSEAELTEPLEVITSSLEAVPTGQRFRLLHGMLLRARAVLGEQPAAGLKAAIAAFEGMGAAYWTARVRVELAQVLVDAGDTGAEELLDVAEPVLRSAGAVRAVGAIERIRASLSAAVGQLVVD